MNHLLAGWKWSTPHRKTSQDEKQQPRTREIIFSQAGSSYFSIGRPCHENRATDQATHLSAGWKPLTFYNCPVSDTATSCSIGTLSHKLNNFETCCKGFQQSVHSMPKKTSKLLSPCKALAPLKLKQLNRMSSPHIWSRPMIP